MPFSKFNEDDASVRSNYEVQRRYGQFGIVYFGQPHEPADAPPIGWVISPQYDNIFRYGEADEFVLCKQGKLGAVCCVDDTYEWIAPCEYDTVDANGQDLIFSKYGEQRYYFHKTHTTRVFSKVDLIDNWGCYIFGVNADFYYIIDSGTDTILWSCSRNDAHLSPWSMFGFEPCFIYMGEKNGLPMLFDAKNGNYIFPNGENKLDFAPDFPNILTPIIVQNENIVNIVTDDFKKVYAGTYDECVQQSLDEAEGFDEITVEIKVTLKSEARTEERCYPIPWNTFGPNDIGDIDIDKWHLGEG